MVVGCGVVSSNYGKYLNCDSCDLMITVISLEIYMAFNHSNHLITKIMVQKLLYICPANSFKFLLCYYHHLQDGLNENTGKAYG